MEERRKEKIKITQLIFYFDIVYFTFDVNIYYLSTRFEFPKLHKRFTFTF